MLDVQTLRAHSDFKRVFWDLSGVGAPVTLLDPVAGYTGDTTVDVSWSRDGQALAIAGLFDASEWVTRLMIVNADGTGLSAVPGIDAARDPSWRPEWVSYHPSAAHSLGNLRPAFNSC
jgi:hypothetical protein